MLNVEVLGFDCAACRKTYRLIDETWGARSATT
jgi:hypothetical protein